MVGVRIGCRAGAGRHAADAYGACPRGANPLVVITAGAPWSFLLTPVLAGSLVVVITALCLNNARSKGSYPKYWL
jgi:CBS-domain-containing membrane protein